MTISYAASTSPVGFIRLALRWKGSIWKSIWQELLIYLLVYYLVAAIYRFVLNDDQQDNFERLSMVFHEYTKQIPLTFLLGFYVSLVVKRWWSQFECVAWPDDILAMTCALWPASEDEQVDKQNADLRHTIARHINLSCVICWREISMKVRERFPTMQHVVNSGLMNRKEMKMFEETEPASVRWQLPLLWIQRQAEKHSANSKIPPPLMGAFIGELKSYRTTFRTLYIYDWICVPLVYTQVAAIATYGYFLFTLIASQFLIDGKKYAGNNVNIVVPIFTIVQFIFYVGWFKVGQDLMRPFGCDDDDIELNYILDRNVAASFALVHTAHRQTPSVDDIGQLYGNPIFPDPSRPGIALPLAHTRLSKNTAGRAPKLHAKVNPKKDDADVTTVEVKDETDKKAKISKKESKKLQNTRHF